MTGLNDETGSEWAKQVLAALGPQQQAERAYQPEPDQVLYAERDIGGWNNIIMAFEVELGLAYDWKRTVMMPRQDLWYLAGQKPKTMFDYFDEKTFRSVVPCIDYDPMLDLHKVTATPHVSPGEERVQLVHRIFGNVESRHLPFLHRALRFRNDILDQALTLLRSNNLTSEPYNALHVRRGDLQFGDVRHIPNATIVEHVQDTLRGKPVLLLSDEYDKDLISRLAAVASRVVCWSDESRSEDGVMDMLSAVPAQEFFGTPLSTFSSGIVKLRKRAGTHTTIRYTHPYNEDSIPDWGRV